MSRASERRHFKASTLAAALFAAIVVAGCSGDGQSTSTTQAGTAPSAPSTTVASTATTNSAAPQVSAESAETVLFNGHVITADDSFTIAEGVAITNGDIVAVGTNDEVMAYVGAETLAVDLDGRSVVPGFVDPHNHLMQSTAYLEDFDLLVDTQDQLIRGGTTTVGTPSVTELDLAVLESFHDMGLLTVRKHLYLDYNGVCGDEELDEFHLSRDFSYDPDLRLAVAGVKIFADGGVCNAPSFAQDYPETVPEQFGDRFTGTGDLYIRAPQIAGVVSDVDEAGGITVIHAIGDRANTEALRGLSEAYDRAPFRHHQRIDHNSTTALLSEEDLAIYSKVGMTPVIFGVSWANGCDPGMTELWQDILAPETFPVVNDSRVLRDANPDLRYSWHGDNPAISGTPLQLAFPFLTQGAVDVETGQPCYPEAWAHKHTVPIEEVLRMITINGAYAMGIEDRVGSLEVGKVADILVLAEDPLGPDPEVAVATNYPLITMMGGTVHHCEGELCGELESLFATPETGPQPEPEVPTDLSVSVSASRDGQGPELMFDGVIGGDSFWSSGRDAPGWVAVNFNEPVTISALRFHVFQNPESDTEHLLEVVVVGSEPREVARFVGFTSTGDILEWVPETPLTGVQAFQMTTFASESWPEWYEIEIEMDAG